ncbi:hypothetical protein BSU04_04280 [Caballeronia sordidicola]|uniref:Uncharacterized protein n=1 Tax=Caballeronia sordidicola TaxID=196367 RepID=A0A226X9A9_CABSO|nr:hypothetical protein BSU04_04280 [Caballeronia sordidicola]
MGEPEARGFVAAVKDGAGKPERGRMKNAGAAAVLRAP